MAMKIAPAYSDTTAINCHVASRSRRVWGVSMNDAALKALIDGLEAHRALLDSWLSGWTWVVVVGVALELVFAFHEHLDDLSLWRLGIVRPPAKPSAGWFIFELFAIALVTIGIVGELKVEANLGNLETQIRDDNGRRLLLLQQQAGEAKTSALAAAEAAARAKADSDDALKKAEIVRRTVDAVSKHADAVDSRVGQTQLLVSSRSILNPDALKKGLSDLKAKAITFRSYTGDAESFFLCLALVTTSVRRSRQLTNVASRALLFRR